MERVLPVTSAQFDSIDSESIDQTRKLVRFMANGQNVNVCMGTCAAKGTNIINQIVYWDRPQLWIDNVLAALRINNPSITFTTIFSK